MGFFKKKPGRKDIEKGIFEIIGNYGEVLEETADFIFGRPESMLLYRKQVIKNAIKVALVLITDKTKIESLKVGYISLAEFIQDEEAMKTKAAIDYLFSYQKMNKEEMKEFLKNAPMEEIEWVLKINEKIIEKQKKLTDEINEFLEKKKS